MAQVSSRRLTEKEWKSIWSVFVEFVAYVNKAQSMTILPVLLTETEQIMLAKRFLITVLYLKGVPPVGISETLKMSRATVYKTISLAKLHPTYLQHIKKHVATLSFGKKKSQSTSYLDKFLQDVFMGRYERWRMYRPTQL